MWHNSSDYICILSPVFSISLWGWNWLKANWWRRRKWARLPLRPLGMILWRALRSSGCNSMILSILENQQILSCLHSFSAMQSLVAPPGFWRSGTWKFLCPHGTVHVGSWCGTCGGEGWDDRGREGSSQTWGSGQASKAKGWKRNWWDLECFLNPSTSGLKPPRQDIQDENWKTYCPCRLAALLCNCRIPLFNCLEGSQDLAKWCKLLQHFEQKFRGRCIKGWQMHNAPSWYYSFDLGGFQAIHVARVHWRMSRVVSRFLFAEGPRSTSRWGDYWRALEFFMTCWHVSFFKRDGLLIACPLQYL